MRRVSVVDHVEISTFSSSERPYLDVSENNGVTRNAMGSRGVIASMDREASV
jgi:hypothetical protein